MDKKEIIRRLKKISEHVVHVTGEPPLPFIMSLDDGIALNEAVRLLKEQEVVEPYVDGEGNYCCKECDTVVGWEELTNAGLTPYVYKFCPMCGRSVKWE